MHPEILSRVLREFRRVDAAHRSDAALELQIQRLGLSDRELEVLRVLVAGKTNKEIAKRLHIAEGTVKNHLTNILEKLGVPDRTRAVVRARELGVVPEP